MSNHGVTLTNRPMTYKKTTPRKTKEINDAVVVLRNAIFTPSGRDKDVTEGIGQYSRNILLYFLIYFYFY